MFEFLKNLFRKNAFGLRLTDKYLQALELSGNAKNLQTKAVGKRNIPANFIKNGKIINKELLAKEIKIFLSELKIKNKKCIVSIPESQSFEHIFYIEVSLKGEEFKVKLEQLIEQVIPLPFHEVEYDYYASVYGNVQAVFVVAVRKDVIAQYYEVLKKLCGLNPIIFEPESLSLLRNISLNLNEDKGAILIDISEDEIAWFLLWKESIFDSSVVAKQKSQGDTKTLIQNLKKSIKNFEKTTKRKVGSVLISGDKNKAIVLSQSLQTSMNQKAQYIEKYRVGSDGSKIVGGLVLRSISQGKKEINLLKN